LAGLLDAEAEPPSTPAAHIAHSDAAIVFTSGATGPAKAVAYSRAGISATRDTLLGHYEFTDDDVLVAAFAPWAVLGPLLGISSVIPAMDASRPGSLTAESLSGGSTGLARPHPTRARRIVSSAAAARGCTDRSLVAARRHGPVAGV
jgi:acyl-CoA synthetase (AMP-forming)/AMP-acid ligase II